MCILGAFYRDIHGNEFYVLGAFYREIHGN